MLLKSFCRGNYVSQSAKYLNGVGVACGHKLSPKHNKTGGVDAVEKRLGGKRGHADNITDSGRANKRIPYMSVFFT